MTKKFGGGGGTGGDGRHAMLAAITSQCGNGVDQKKAPPDKTSVMLNAITKHRESDTTTNNPRDSLISAITNRSTEGDNRSPWVRFDGSFCNMRICVGWET